MDGVIIVNKPKGKTSFQIVQFIRKLTGVRKVGHTGTLDPLATGVLPICIGKATRIVRFFLDSDKQYQGKMVLGIETDTQDAAGSITNRVPQVSVTQEAVEEVLTQFRGEILQVPPMVSALHYQGQRLYKLAREGKNVERKPRKIHIKDLRLISFTDGSYPEVNFVVTCSKGTYVRTLCTDMGRLLGCGAHQAELCRTRCGPFQLSQAKTLEELQDLTRQGKLPEVLLSIGEVLSSLK